MAKAGNRNCEHISRGRRAKVKRLGNQQSTGKETQRDEKNEQTLSVVED